MWISLYLRNLKQNFAGFYNLSEYFINEGDKFILSLWLILNYRCSIYDYR